MSSQPVPPITFYSDLERSIWKAITDLLAARGLASIMVFNNLVDKMQFPNVHHGISIMKLTDVPNAANGGGPHAYLKTKVAANGGNPTYYNYQDWPDAFDEVYQLMCVTDNLEDLRNMEQAIRDVFRPKGRPLYLWDINANAWSKSYCNFSYAGYINRDEPEQHLYWRITNIRFEAYNYHNDDTRVSAIKQTPTLDFDVTGQS